ALATLDVEVNPDQVGRVVSVDEVDQPLSAGAVEYAVGSSGADDVFLARVDEGLNVGGFHRRSDAGPGFRTAGASGESRDQRRVRHDAGDRLDRARYRCALQAAVKVGVNG